MSFSPWSKSGWPQGAGESVNEASRPCHVLPCLDFYPPLSSAQACTPFPGCHFLCR